MSRPMISMRIEAMEAAFAERREDGAFLQALLAELNHRSTKRAMALKASVLHTSKKEDDDARISNRQSDAPETPSRSRIETKVYENMGGNALVEPNLALSWPIQVIDLPARPRELLTKMGIRYLGEAVRLTPVDLLRTKNFGVRSLRALEEAFTRHGLAFGMNVEGWRPGENRELPELDLGIADALRGPISGEKNLHQGLARVIAMVEPLERNAALIARQTGWDGRGGETLEAVGQSYGITRERVRQIVARANRRLKSRRAPTILAEAITIADASTPCTARDLQAVLHAAGVTQSNFEPAGLITAAQSFALPCNFELACGPTQQVLIPLGHAPAFERLNVRARRQVSAKGCGDLQDLADELTEAIKHPIPESVVVEFVGASDAFEWLDHSDGWFWYRPGEFAPRNRLINTIKRVLAASPRITLAELRAAVRKTHRMGGFAPPTKVLRELCRPLTFVGVEDNEVTRIEHATDWSDVLGGTEQIFLAVLRKFGPVLSRLEFMQRCQAAGMKEGTFSVSSTYSPIVWRPAPGYYALIGAEFPPGTIEALRRQRHRTPSMKLDSGWTADGRVYASWQLRYSNISSGVVNFPKALAPYLQGEFVLNDEIGTVIGSIKVTDSTCWNLRRFLRRSGAVQNEILLLVFSPSDRKCLAITGNVELLQIIEADEFAKFTHPAPDAANFIELEAPQEPSTNGD